MKNLLFITDPVDKLNLQTDTTLQIVQEAINRGYNVFFALPQDISFCNCRVFAQTSKFKIDLNNNISEYLGSEVRDLKEMDAIFIRQDPPFDMNYITVTYLLDLVKNNVKIINNPTEIRNSPEKFLPCHFPSLLPPTLITKDKKEIINFLNIHKEVVIKPLYLHGGREVFKLSEHDPNLHTILEHFMNMSHQFIVQKYLHTVVETGDKRIILIDGEIVAGFKRMPQNGIRSNMVVGGIAEKHTLTARDIEICQAIKAELKSRKLFLVGIDVIGDYLTEINVTSPTGFVPIKQLYGINAAQLLLARIFD